jgi:hypothetical protein
VVVGSFAAAGIAVALLSALPGIATDAEAETQPLARPLARNAAFSLAAATGAALLIFLIVLVNFIAD